MSLAKFSRPVRPDESLQDLFVRLHGTHDQSKHGDHGTGGGGGLMARAKADMSGDKPSGGGTNKHGVEVNKIGMGSRVSYEYKGDTHRGIVTRLPPRHGRDTPMNVRRMGADGKPSSKNDKIKVDDVTGVGA